MGKIKKLNKKIALLVAVFFFSFNTLSIYNVSADVGSLTVGGGSLGTSGLEELSALFPYAAPIILGMFHQADMDVKLSQASQAAGMTKTQYLYDQIINWKQDAPSAISQVCERILTGTSIDSEGIIYLGQNALDTIKQLGNWIVTNVGENFANTDTPVSDFDVVNCGDFSTYYGTSLTFYAPGLRRDRTFTSSNSVAFVIAMIGTTTQIVAFSKNPFSLYLDGANQTVSQTGDFYIAVIGQYATNLRPSLYDIGSFADSWSIRSYISGLSNFEVVNNSTPENCFEGSAASWLSFVQGLTLPSGYTGAIDFNILNRILAELEESKNYEMTVEDYLQAINEAVNDQAIDVPIENVDDGSIDFVPDVVIVPDPAYDPVADPDIPVPEEVTPVIDDEAPPNFEELMNQPLTLDLKRLFPFCIPFDLYNLFQKFNAPAIAPHFRINFTVPIVNQEVDYTIDFSPFNDVAAVLRTMELIAMVVLLAIATRRIFLRG